MTPSFRSDINGLRACAVLAVMLYHFGIPGFAGGFVGVDVFFAISGYLMTGIVVSGLEREGFAFSIVSFYMARARRILPALIVLCATLLACGWWFLPPSDYSALGTHAAYSVTFLSNVKFWQESGYFDSTSHDKWLLHTWSLAVEWQFYLLLPLAIFAAWKIRASRASVTWLVAAGLVLSLGLSIAATPMKPTGSFFLLPARAWEMLAGGLVFLTEHRLPMSQRTRAASAHAGLFLVLASIIGFDAASPWPGWRATLPVTGAVLILLAARTQSWWTGNPFAQWLGTRSYSLYLWHWPIVVALVYLEWKEVPVAIAAGLGLTLVLGDISFRYVEAPARKILAKLPWKRSAVGIAGVAMVVAAGGSAIHLQHGVAGRFSPQVDITSLEAGNTNPRQAKCHPSTGVASPSCTYGGNQMMAIVLGDSHANAVVTAMAAAMEQRLGGGVMQWSYSACPILQGVNQVAVSQNQCGAFVDWALKSLESVPTHIPVVIVNRHGQYALGKNEISSQAGTPGVYFSHKYASAEPQFLAEYAQHLTSTACNFAKSHTVYLLRPIPEMGANVPSTARGMVLGRPKDVSISLVEYHTRNDFIWRAQDAARERCGVKILDPLPYLCSDDRCRGSVNGRPLYYDDNHLSEYGNRLLIPLFSTVQF